MSLYDVRKNASCEVFLSSGVLHHGGIGILLQLQNQNLSSLVPIDPGHWFLWLAEFVLHVLCELARTMQAFLGLLSF